MEGIVCRYTRSQFQKNWVRRYIVLRDNELAVFKVKGEGPSGRPTRVIDLSDVVMIRKNTADASPGETEHGIDVEESIAHADDGENDEYHPAGAQFVFEFRIETPGKAYLFASASAEDRQKWISAVQDARWKIASGTCSDAICSFHTYSPDTNQCALFLLKEIRKLDVKWQDGDEFRGFIQKALNDICRTQDPHSDSEHDEGSVHHDEESGSARARDSISSSSSLLNSTWEIDPSAVEVDAKISEGFFGNVYRGKLWGKEVAVKELKCDRITSEMLSELRREVNIMSACRHPNVVLFMGASTQPPRVYIVTELIANGDIYAILKNNHGLSDKLLLKILSGVIQGMTYLHNRKIVHLDLKPMNVLIDENFNAKICDFGLSKVLKADQKRLRKSGAVYGTPLYRAPETIFEDEFGYKADLYSFGILLFEVFYIIDHTDTNFFLDDEVAFDTVVSDIMSGKMLTFPPWWNPLLVYVLRWCIQKNPEDRPEFSDLLPILSTFYGASAPESQLWSRVKEDPSYARYLPTGEGSILHTSSNFPIRIYNARRLYELSIVACNEGDADLPKRLFAWDALSTLKHLAKCPDPSVKIYSGYALIRLSFTPSVCSLYASDGERTPLSVKHNILEAGILSLLAYSRLETLEMLALTSREFADCIEIALNTVLATLSQRRSSSVSKDNRAPAEKVVTPPPGADEPLEGPEPFLKPSFDLLLVLINIASHPDVFAMLVDDLFERNVFQYLLRLFERCSLRAEQKQVDKIQRLGALFLLRLCEAHAVRRLLIAHPESSRRLFSESQEATHRRTTPVHCLQWLIMCNDVKAKRNAGSAFKHLLDGLSFFRVSKAVAAKVKTMCLSNYLLAGDEKSRDNLIRRNIIKPRDATHSVRVDRSASGAPAPSSSEPALSSPLSEDSPKSDSTTAGGRRRTVRFGGSSGEDSPMEPSDGGDSPAEFRRSASGSGFQGSSIERRPKQRLRPVQQEYRNSCSILESFIPRRYTIVSKQKPSLSRGKADEYHPEVVHRELRAWMNESGCDIDSLRMKDVFDHFISTRKMSADLVQQHKRDIEQLVYRVLGEMERPSLVFEHKQTKTRMYLGNQYNAENVEELRALGIGYIINVTLEVPMSSYVDECHAYFTVPVEDEPKVDLTPFFEDLYSIVHTVLKTGPKDFVRAECPELKLEHVQAYFPSSSGDDTSSLRPGEIRPNLLVHCARGISRSATVVLLFMCRYLQMNPGPALHELRSKRPEVEPNDGFWEQLCTWLHDCVQDEVQQ